MWLSGLRCIRFVVYASWYTLRGIRFVVRYLVRFMVYSPWPPLDVIAVVVELGEPVLPGHRGCEKTGTLVSLLNGNVSVIFRRERYCHL